MYYTIFPLKVDSFLDSSIYIHITINFRVVSSFLKKLHITSSHLPFLPKLLQQLCFSCFGFPSSV